MTRVMATTKMQRRLEQLVDAFARDSERSAAKEVAQKVREIKAKLVVEARSLESAVDATRWLGVLGFVASLGVRRVLQQLHEGDRRARELLDECSFLLEDVVMTAYHVLLNVTSDDPSTPLSSSPSVSGVDASLLVSAFTRVLAFSMSSPSCLLVWTHVGLLAAVVSLRTTRATRAADLLDAVVSQCRASDATERHAACPLFLRGLVHAIVDRDDAAALRCVREALALAKRTNPHGNGVFHYWYAVVLSRNGLATAAMDQLSEAVKNDFEPVASLNLQALLGLQASDHHAAAEALERAVDIDFDEAASMFNYGVLLREMENHGAQFQMLEYYVEAIEQAKEGGKTEKRAKTDTTTEGLTLFPGNETDRLLPCSRSDVAKGEVLQKMAMAALESGAWQDARIKFEEYFEVTRHIASSQLYDYEAMIRSFVYVLLQCDRPTQALEQCNLALRENAMDLYIQFYKADALLCLERVDECESQLRRVIQPRLTDQKLDGELKDLHVQLLNNLSIASVCRGGVDAAVEMLRDSSRLYPDNLSLKFNLAMLLWRLDRRDPACSLWFEARGWSLQMDVGSMKDQQQALDIVARVEEEALCSVKHPRITSHVTDSSETSGEIDEWQLRYLDALILNYWGNAQSSVVAKTAAQYVEYLETVVARMTK